MNPQNITPDSLSEIISASPSDRKLRAYAYLQASFAAKPKFGQEITDIVDCILPFLIEGIARQAGEQINLKQLQDFLLESFDFKIPIFAVEQMLPRAQNVGALTWSNDFKVYTCNDIRNEFGDPSVPRTLLDEDFDRIETLLARYASNLGHASPLYSPNWTDALISFLKSGSEIGEAKTTIIAGTVVSDAEKLDNYIVARFVQETFETDRNTFDSITKIFTGVIIEEFISTIQEIGTPEDYDHLTVYYDTSVLLRLLGSSGKGLADASLEVHNALQNLGCTTSYLEHNENEVANILAAIIANYDTGRELYGETAEALLDGEINIPFIRDLSATFVERLAQLNTFKSKFAYENTRTANYYQIDEREFEVFLKAEAETRHALYNIQNRINDSKSLAVVMRLRHGARHQDIAKTKHVFISVNKLLVRCARKFIAEEEEFGWRNAPPMLTIGQMATLAWLAGTRELEPSKVTKGLLANCYGAVQPDPDWTPEFLAALDQYKEQQHDTTIAESAVFLQTARRIAQDQSLSNTAILRKLTTAEIFSRAAREAKLREDAAQSTTYALEANALKAGITKGRSEADDEIKKAVRNRAERWADKTLWLSKSLIVILFILSLLLKEGAFGAERSFSIIFAQIIFLFMTVGTILDLVGVKFVSRQFDRLRKFFLDSFIKFFTVK